MKSVEVVGACWHWTKAMARCGYGKVKHKGKTVHTHRVSYELFRGPIEAGKWVLHTCDVRACVNPDHLYLGTAKDNMRDMLERNRMNPSKGAECSFSKLTDNQVLEICKNEERLSTSRLGQKYGVSKSTIISIQNRKTWQHVDVDTVNKLPRTEKKPVAPPRRKGVPLYDRIMSRVTKSDTCWLWTGFLMGSGHGAITVNYKHTLVHRGVWEHFNGPIPKGRPVRHLCQNLHCVNPEHLLCASTPTKQSP